MLCSAVRCYQFVRIQLGIHVLEGTGGYLGQIVQSVATKNGDVLIHVDLVAGKQSCSQRSEAFLNVFRIVFGTVTLKELELIVRGLFQNLA